MKKLTSILLFLLVSNISALEFSISLNQEQKTGKIESLIIDDLKLLLINHKFVDNNDSNKINVVVEYNASNPNFQILFDFVFSLANEKSNFKFSLSYDEGIEESEAFKLLLIKDIFDQIRKNKSFFGTLFPQILEVKGKSITLANSKLFPLHSNRKIQLTNLADMVSFKNQIANGYVFDISLSVVEINLYDEINIDLDNAFIILLPEKELSYAVGLGVEFPVDSFGAVDLSQSLAFALSDYFAIKIDNAILYYLTYPNTFFQVSLGLGLRYNVQTPPLALYTDISFGYSYFNSVSQNTSGFSPVMIFLGGAYFKNIKDLPIYLESGVLVDLMSTNRSIPIPHRIFVHLGFIF